ncbi:MAG: tripartite tricarboxylate transporter substrate binding protein [Betaproteobacteria bacterium]|nr:MAG: tripartite tricarboxylate transporter substrate binding protein [Betaproteobacteria bacterium]TAG49411.1 MAG: tripartite tricarboxylate transporter substrate binding protein [Betaproteobacteria bacterium]
MRIFKTLTVLACVIGSVSALAQAWPAKPVKLINPFPAGGGTDTFARPLSAQLTKQTGHQFVVENIGGAGGTIGAAQAARAAPDGYTFLIGAVHHAIAPSMYPKLAYDIEKDFVPVTLLAIMPFVIVAQPDKLPNVKTVKDLVEHTKANPAKLAFGSSGAGTSQHLAGELFKSNQGVNILHVPYKGMGPAMTDFLGGQLDVLFDGMSASAAQIRAGKARPLGLMAAKRSTQYPDIPTMAEQGFPNLEVSQWFALWAVKGTPPDVVDKMYREVVKALEDPAIKANWAAASADAGGMPPAEFGKFVRAEIERWARVAKVSGAKLDQ